jgi:L-rhamnose mutarotase
LLRRYAPRYDVELNNGLRNDKPTFAEAAVGDARNDKRKTINELYMVAKRFGFKMKLLPGCGEEYKKRHSEIWPELVGLLKKEGVCNYSIFLDEETNTLFAYQEQAGENSSQDLGKTELVQKWWKYMADIMEANPDNSPVTIELEQVFYME